MSYYNIVRSGACFVEARSPNASANNDQSYFLFKIERKWDSDWQKHDLGYSAIGRKHGDITDYAKIQDGKQLSYILVAEETNPKIRVNFEDQKLFAADQIRIRMGKDDQLDIVLDWDDTQNTYFFYLTDDQYQFVQVMAGAVVPCSISVAP